MLLTVVVCVGCTMQMARDSRILGITIVLRFVKILELLVGTCVSGVICLLQISKFDIVKSKCYDTTLIILEDKIVAMGRRSMNVDVAVMCWYRSYLGDLRYSL
jgi:hypothetical protein